MTSPVPCDRSGQLRPSPIGRRAIVGSRCAETLGLFRLFSHRPVDRICLHMPLFSSHMRESETAPHAFLALKGFIRNRSHHRHFGRGCGGGDTRWAFCFGRLWGYRGWSPGPQPFSALICSSPDLSHYHRALAARTVPRSAVGRGDCCRAPPVDLREAGRFPLRRFAEHLVDDYERPDSW